MQTCQYLIKHSSMKPKYLKMKRARIEDEFEYIEEACTHIDGRYLTYYETENPIGSTDYDHVKGWIFEGLYGDADRELESINMDLLFHVKDGITYNEGINLVDDIIYIQPKKQKANEKYSLNEVKEHTIFKISIPLEKVRVVKPDTENCYLFASETMRQRHDEFFYEEGSPSIYDFDDVREFLHKNYLVKKDQTFHLIRCLITDLSFKELQIGVKEGTISREDILKIEGVIVYVV
jgi:hypothetical protein